MLIDTMFRLTEEKWKTIGRDYDDLLIYYIMLDQIQ